jgi:HAD superfamily hydrolase (TIGR01509 family)
LGIQTDRVKAILFDIDGTLSDSDDQMVQSVERILKVFYRSNESCHSLARWLVMAVESPGNFLYNLADRFDLDSLFIRLLNKKTRRKKHRVRKYWIIPGVEALLIVLAAKYHLGVVSARDERTTLAFLRQFDLEKYFSVVVTSQTCRYTKPFPDPLLYAAECLAVEPGECLMVGDTTVDMKAAVYAGMQAVGVLCGFGRQRELERAGADQILQTTADLLNILCN